MVKFLLKTKEQYKQNIHLIIISNNSCDEIILKLSNDCDNKEDLEICVDKNFLR